jgi:glyoxylase-like metal-dependent hydrolase (beta-lactamase superfamily II)
MKPTLRIFASLSLTLAAMLGGAARAADTVTTPRLYAIDCGRIEFDNMAPFSDTGEYDGKSGKLVASCFLIRHPKGTLLWDTGLGDALAAKPEGISEGGHHLSVPVTLAAQLKSLGLAPADVNYLAFSHFHFDHTGNANEFPDATWILNKSELAWATQPGNGLANADSFSDYKTAKTQMIDGDYDVFGDGSVRIHKTPGHTPGHQVLELKLKKSGVVILSGDLYHTHANRTAKRVPLFNTERADTLASMDRVEKIIKNTHARLVIQHAPEDLAALPKLPAYLD